MGEFVPRCAASGRAHRGATVDKTQPRSAGGTTDRDLDRFATSVQRAPSICIHHAHHGMQMVKVAIHRLLVEPRRRRNSQLGSVFQSTPTQGSRSGPPRNRTSNQHSSTSARWQSKPPSVRSDGRSFWISSSPHSPSDLSNTVSSWQARYWPSSWSSEPPGSGSIRIQHLFSKRATAVWSPIAYPASGQSKVAAGLWPDVPLNFCRWGATDGLNVSRSWVPLSPERHELLDDIGH